MRAVVLSALVVAPCLAAVPGSAAVRLCERDVASGLVRGASEAEARKQALELWRRQAAAFGEAYTSWRLAAGKLLTCLPRVEGDVECLAKGQPCTIEQAPARRANRLKRLEM